MNWKSTLVLAALFAVALALYLLSGPGTAAPRADLERVLGGLDIDRLSRIEIARRGEPAWFVERARDSVGDHWRLAPPVDRPADVERVKRMIYSIDRFRRGGALDPSSPEAGPAVTGLADPRVVVTFYAGDRKETVRVGASPPTNSEAVFFQKDGDPAVYLCEIDVLQAYDTGPDEVRVREVLRYAPHQVVKVELRRKFVVARGRDPKDRSVEIETSVLERFEDGPERGWHLVEPHKERLDDLRVGRLVTDLSSLRAEEIRRLDDPKALGLDVPRVAVVLHVKGRGEPLTLHFGDVVEHEWRAATVPGSGEALMVPEYRFQDIPTERKSLRSDALFPFSRDAVRTFELEVPGKGRMKIERREKAREGEVVPVVSWELVEPAGLRIRADKVEPLVARVMGGYRITDFLGPQDDLKVFRLDPADVVLRIRDAEGKDHAWHFGAAEKATAGWMRKEGVAEIFGVKPELVRMMARLELPLIHEEIYNVPRETIRRFSFEHRKPGETLRYEMALEGGVWSFVDPVFKGRKVDLDALNVRVGTMNYILAEDGTFAGRDEETARKYRLHELQAPQTLRIAAEAEPREVVVFISEDQNDGPGTSVFYARRADSPMVFKINAGFVKQLRKPPVGD